MIWHSMRVWGTIFWLRKVWLRATIPSSTQRNPAVLFSMQTIRKAAQTVSEIRTLWCCSHIMSLEGTLHLCCTCREGFIFDSVVVEALKRICCRCGATYSVNQSGKHTRKEECNYHYGRGVTKRGELPQFEAFEMFPIQLAPSDDCEHVSQFPVEWRPATAAVRESWEHLDVRCFR